MRQAAVRERGNWRGAWPWSVAEPRGLDWRSRGNFSARARACSCWTATERPGKMWRRNRAARAPAAPLIFLAADLREEGEVREAIEEVRKRAGHLDVLVNNAGIELERSVTEWTMAEWDLILKVNLRGAFLLTQAALPLFPAEGGAIVNISSIHATHAFPGSIPYACSKAGLIALTRNLALELAPRHIRVNSVCPGYIDTRLWDEYLKKAANSAELAAHTTALHPLGRRGLPADVAEAVLFLAGESSSFVTGSDLIVDGGLTLRAHN